MYLFMPHIFFVPVYYVKLDILDIKEMEILQQCNSRAITDKITKGKKIVIGASLPTQREVRWVKDMEAMEKEAKDKEVTLKVEINDFDLAKQVSQVDNLISQGIDVLIMMPIDNVKSVEMVEKAHKAGIKVISYDLLTPNTDIDLYIAFNNIRVGELQGKYLIQKVPKGNYVIMYGIPEPGLKAAAMQYIQPLVNLGKIKIVADKGIEGYDPKIAYQIVKDALIANDNNIDAILAPNDNTAGGAIEALKEEDLAGKVAVVGQDADLAAVRRIIEETQLMTVFKDAAEEGKTAVDSAIKLAKKQGIDTNDQVNNGKMDVPTILIAPIAIDKSNIDSILIDSGYYKKEQVYYK